MREEKLLLDIKSIIGDKYIGDDCAYLKELGILVSQDSLVEDVHFCLEYMTPFQLGYKSGMVNVSDIAASGGECKYVSVGISLPKNISDDFVKEFYQGLTKALNECGDIEVIGGDITGSDKVMISITVIGVDKNRKISSRSGAISDQVIVTSGVHGSSCAGLKLLQDDKNISDELYKKFVIPHLMPVARGDFARKISENIKENYSMMDSSDGLADVLFKIAQSSKKTLVVDFDKVLYDEKLSENFPDVYQQMVLFGGEDYQIVATVPIEFAKEYNLHIIGHVEDKIEGVPVKVLNYDNGELIINNLDGCFKHFG